MALITPDGTLSYPHLFTPQMPPNPRPGQKARFQTVLLFPKIMTEEDNQKLLQMKQAALKALQEKWGANVEKMLAEGALRWPFSKKFTNKRGELKYDPEKWQCLINPWSEQPPGIVSRYRGPDGKPAKIVDQQEIYSGCIARLSVNCFVYEAQGNWGVNFGLQNVQKRGDGPRLDNRQSAQDAFDAEDAPEAELDGAAPSGNAAAFDPGTMAAGSKLADLFT
jgi:hypothetical protein